MSSGRSWDRQKGELDAYNAFLSAYRSRSSYHGFSERGYRLTNYFPTIDNRFTETAIKPDFSLFDNETLILAEVKQGDNINPGDIEQAERLASVSIDAAEEYMKKINVQERFGFDDDVYAVEPLIYYDGIDSDYIRQCRNDWPDCRDKLEQLEAACPVLGRVDGRRLRLLSGEFDSEELTSWLDYGIKMAETPQVMVTMTDGLEIESVAVSICTIWGQRAVAEPVKVDISQLRRHFNYRSLEPGRVESAFEFIDEVGAGDRISKRELEFRPEHMSELLDIESHARNRGGGGSESELNDFSQDG
ncbi:hypothetical protein EGH24_10910 [Halonotius terrestris]|uniref:Uncharacterized protein n=1 Tax=Halonotius terrestris TaxID=2487750 RepID=A0A8J8PBY6_9EURY|nr:hypothetical protein [Halonotius terrestris]TQQ79977.1 hypothetical protein EGH24_10910 [Halonotius terrestris]